MELDRIITGDAKTILPGLPAGSIDSIITDPPYGLEFMGKEWDTLGAHAEARVRRASEITSESKGPYLRSGVNSYGKDGAAMQEWHHAWAEAALRVAKPGAILMAFGGTRTHHRLMCAIEDAGWEIRDCLMYLYGTGFPKSHNWPVKLHEKACTWHGNMVVYDHEQGTESSAKHGMRFVRATYLSQAVYACAECGQVLQPFMPKQGVSEHRQAWTKSEVVWPEQSRVEGRRDMEAAKGELPRCEVCTLSGRPIADGTEGWIHNGTSTGNGPPSWAALEADGSCTSYRPRSVEQFYREPDALSVERRAQTSRGYGSSLKPAWEPIVLAMKPLDGTFAANAQKHGVAGLWIDGARIETNAGDYEHPGNLEMAANDGGIGANSYQWAKTGGRWKQSLAHPKGRWPANVVHDGSDEVVGMFPDTGKSTGGSGPASRDYCGDGRTVAGSCAATGGFGDSGSAARFFYCAKASRAEREGGLRGHIPCIQCGVVDSRRHITDRETGKALPLSRAGEGEVWALEKIQAEAKVYRDAMKRGEKRDPPRFGLVSCVRNGHPTVKPLALMEYLCRLTRTPTGGVVLDPFCGSGSTLMACVNARRSYIGIDSDPESVATAKKRVAWAKAHLTTDSPLFAETPDG